MTAKKTAKKTTKKAAKKSAAKTRPSKTTRKSAAKKSAKKASSKKAAKAAAAKKAAKKVSPKKVSAKKVLAKKASAKKAAKAPAKKAAKKPAPKKEAAKAAAKAPAKKAAEAGKPKPRSRSRRSSKPKVELLLGAAPPADRPSSPYGNKHECFECETKFYDLNKEEVICPKCGTDQSAKPKKTAKSVTPAPEKKARRGKAAQRPMEPLLDDEEEGAPERIDEDLGLGIATNTAPETTDRNDADFELDAPDGELELE